MRLSLRNLAIATALLCTTATFAQTTSTRSYFPYSLKAIHQSVNLNTFMFCSGGAAASAVLHLKNVETGEVTSIPLPGTVSAGENIYDIDLLDYVDAPAGTTYTWSVELHNYPIANDIVSGTTSVGGGRAGVVCMTDPNNEFYGYMVIGRTQNGGFDVYDPAGKKIKALIHQDNAAMGGTGANTSCPMHGVQRGTTAQFASWGDKANGVVALDLANLDAKPYGVFEGTNTGNGTIMNGNTKVGSGTPTATYFGEGENTLLMTFDEDIFGNKITFNPIGTAMTTGKAAQLWGNGFNDKLANTNVDMVATKNGLFVTQIRANGMEAGVVGLGFIIPNGENGQPEMIWKAADEAANYPDFLPSAAAGVDINPAGDLLAVAMYTGIKIFKLSWDGVKPVLEPYKTVTSPQAGNYTDVKFDAGNNLHVINQSKGYYDIVLANQESVIVTPAMEDNTVVVHEIPETLSTRGQFAYNLSQTLQGENTYNFSFKATGAAASAVLLLQKTGTEEVNSVELGEVTKGENTFTVDLSDYAPETATEFNWSIEIHNNPIVQEGVTGKAVNIGGNRAGVVCMTDPTNDYYGYTVIGRTKNGGFDVYDPTGTLIKSAIHKNNAAMGGTAANNSCPMRGVQRGTTAQFACWGDAANGVVALDLANLDAAPYSVFEGSKIGNGTTMNGDIAVGSGTPCVAYVGEGENTLLMTFDEDIFGNNIAANPIGTAMTTGKAAELWGTGFKSSLVNTNVGMVGTKNGLFVSQTRANGMESGVVGLAYITRNGENGQPEMIWKAADESANYPDFLPSATGGIDINPAGDMLAISTYTGINVYKLSWDGEKPVLEPYKSIPSVYQTGDYTTVKFDAGNNLHVINQINGYYQVVLAQDENIATTPAATPFTMQFVTSVENVSYDEQDATPVYYNLMGVRVDGELTPGVYVKVVGKKATKVLVK